MTSESVSSLLNTRCFDSLLCSHHQLKYKNYATLRSVPIPDNGHPLAAHINRKCIDFREIKNIYIHDIFNDVIRTRYIGQYALRSKRPENLSSIAGGKRHVSCHRLWAPSSILSNGCQGGKATGRLYQPPCSNEGKNGVKPPQKDEGLF